MIHAECFIDVSLENKNASGRFCAVMKNKTLSNKSGFSIGHTYFF